jgi:pyrimidine-specific ribonucleoside hydrolase
MMGRGKLFMKLLIETDLGGDADDFFVILYLISAGVDIKGIILSPGYKDQVAIARFICNATGVSIPIGSARPESPKTAERGFHHKIMDKCGYPNKLEEADFSGEELMMNVMREHPDCEFFGCGPLMSMGKFLGAYPDIAKPKKATMQGGFLSYNYHKPAILVDRFVGKETCPSFNMNGNKDGVLRFIDADIPDRRFVGKNVCHSLVYNNEVHQKVLATTTMNKAHELFKRSMTMFLATHGEKKFHDPFAAACHLHPEIATWVAGKPYCLKGEWGVKVGIKNSNVAADVNREEFWKHIAEGN